MQSLTAATPSSRDTVLQWTTKVPPATITSHVKVEHTTRRVNREERAMERHVKGLLGGGGPLNRPEWGVCGAEVNRPVEQRTVRPGVLRNLYQPLQPPFHSSLMPPEALVRNQGMSKHTHPCSGPKGPLLRTWLQPYFSPHQSSSSMSR